MSAYSALLCFYVANDTTLLMILVQKIKIYYIIDLNHIESR